MFISISAIISLFVFTNNYFRISKMFNHLIVFNQKYFWGIITGVFIANLLMSTLGVFEILGLLQSVVSLTMTISVSYFVKNRLVLMGINTLIFTFNMYIVAFMLKLAL